MALLAISGSVLVISGLTKMLKEQVAISQSDSIKDWQIFCQQMRFELSGTKLDRVEQDFLYVTKDKKLRFGFMRDDFRKTDDKGQGYQQMLYDIKAAKIQATKNLITIRIDFNQGGERTFIYQFPEDT
ncbi:Late competence protein ComGF access of DNA to ComEA [Lactococcus lactis subsp. lactis]|nr:Late competence protein ComGF access of DNA to ComEA [Lactococcus lactis subsp. lactis]